MQQTYADYLLAFQKNSRLVSQLPQYDLYQDLQNEDFFYQVLPEEDSRWPERNLQNSEIGLLPVAQAQLLARLKYLEKLTGKDRTIFIQEKIEPLLNKR